MPEVINKKVKLNLVGVDSNAFSIMGAFTRAARKSQWTKDETDKVLAEAMNGNYNHLVATIQAHCE